MADARGLVRVALSPLRQALGALRREGATRAELVAGSYVEHAVECLQNAFAALSEAPGAGDTKAGEDVPDFKSRAAGA